jgi:hypothetical protein
MTKNTENSLNEFLWYTNWQPSELQESHLSNDSLCEECFTSGTLALSKQFLAYISPYNEMWNNSDAVICLRVNWYLLYQQNC